MAIIFILSTFPLNSDLKNQPDGAMIRPVDGIIDESLFNPSFVDDILGNKKIIDTPPDIAISRFEPVRPPRVLYGIRVQVAEGVEHRAYLLGRHDGVVRVGLVRKGEADVRVNQVVVFEQLIAIRVF